MLRKLKEHPHCNNCRNLKKRKAYHCKSWKSRVHPEHAGHLHKEIEGSHSVFHLTCHSYSPSKHVR